MADWFTRRTSALLDRLDEFLETPVATPYDKLMTLISLLAVRGETGIWQDVLLHSAPGDQPDVLLERLEAAMEAHNIS